jgi:diguanylate cyclase (GGDEF)-like protein/PAS domain S-box-containing protein
LGEQAFFVAPSLPPAELLIDAAPDGVLVVNDEGLIVGVNARLEALLRSPREALLGTRFESLASPEKRAIHLDAARQWLAHPGAMPPVVGEVWRPDGTSVPVEIAIAPCTVEGRTWAIAHVREITERRRLDEHQVFVSVHDGLTGAANRAAFDDALSRLSAQGPWPVGVVMVDLDGLKVLNDERGHESGDRQLRVAAGLLLRVFRASDLVARIGGDEFAVLAGGSDEAVMKMLEARLEAARLELNLTHRPPLRWSVGTAVARQTELLSGALQRADSQMYEVKAVHHLERRARQPE